MITPLQYGKTNTYFISNGNAGLVVDTGWAGTLPAFYKEIKRQEIAINAIQYLIITHYHPDHMGLAGELMSMGIKLLIMDVQLSHVHDSDAIFYKEGRSGYKPIKEKDAVVLSCLESRKTLNEIGIDGEIVHTPGHSDDSISIVLDEGIALVGDLPPFDIALALGNETITKSWNELLRYNLNTVFYGHANVGKLCNIHSVDDLRQP